MLKWYGITTTEKCVQLLEKAIVTYKMRKLFLRVCFVFPGVNLLVGTENGLKLLDRSGQGKVYPLINSRRFQQMDVLEGLNLLITISGQCCCPEPVCSHCSWLKLSALLASVWSGMPNTACQIVLVSSVYSDTKAIFYHSVWISSYSNTKNRNVTKIRFENI